MIGDADLSHFSPRQWLQDAARLLIAALAFAAGVAPAADPLLVIAGNLDAATAGTFNIGNVALSQRFVVKAPGTIRQIEVQLQGDGPVDLALSLSVGGESLFATTFRRVVSQPSGLMVLPVQSSRVVKVGEVVTMTVTPSAFVRVARVAENNADWPPMPIKGGPTALHFRATGLDGRQLSIASGDKQTVPLAGGPPAMARFAPLAVKLSIPGKSAAGAMVTFACHAGSGNGNGGRAVCQLSPAGTDNGTLAVPTDANGVAILNQVSGSILYYYGQGAFTVTANTPDAPQAVTFQLVTGTYSNPYAATIVSGNNQTVMRSGDQPLGGMSNFAPLVIKVTDKGTGNPVGGARVYFSCASQTCNFAPTCPPYCGVTGQDGMASSGPWSSYYGTGGFSVNATGDAFDPIAFGETSVPVPPPPPVTVASPQLAIAAGNGQQLARSGTNPPGGSAKFAPLSVRLTDGSGKPVSGAVITFSAHPPTPACQFDPSGTDNGTITQVTDGNGTATMNRMAGAGLECYYFIGPLTVTATFSGVTVTFQLKVTS